MSEIKSGSPDQKFMNLGIEIETKSLGTVVVKELTLESIQKFTTEIAFLISRIDLKALEDQTNEVAMIAKMIVGPEAIEALKSILGASMNRPKEDLTGAPLSDILKITKGFISVNDLQELRELFTQVFKPKA